MVLKHRDKEILSFKNMSGFFHFPTCTCIHSLVDHGQTIHSSHYATTSNPGKIKFRIFAFLHNQFGDWAGQLGDGRAVMLGEYTNRYTDDVMQNFLACENI